MASGSKIVLNIAPFVYLYILVVYKPDFTYRVPYVKQGNGVLLTRPL